MKFYPRAHENRLPTNHPSLRGPRKAFMKAAATNFLYLQILFLALFAYIFGSLFQQAPHTHNLNVLYVDYDNGIIGTTIRSAYNQLQGDSFPTLVERSPSEFATADDLIREVCDTQYWAALYTSRGASDRLQQAALTGDSAAYDKTDVLTYVWNEARYSAVIDSSVSANLQTLSSEARVVYAAGNWTGAIENATTATFSIFADPWQLTSINIQPTTQGSRLIYNTLVIILILIQEFFYLGTINSLYEAFKIYSHLNPHRIIIFRNLVSIAYTFIGSLCTVGAIWAFRSDWQVNGNQFVLSWAILWLFAHVNFLTLDVFTVWLPPPFVPMALITWIVLNITSILLPFELSPGFYSWAYAMPAHEVYQVLVDIWSGGCNPKLSYALPVLFAFELSGLTFGGIGVYRRAHYAVIKNEAEQQAFQARLDTAVAFFQEKEEKRRKEWAAAAMSRGSSEANAVNEEKGEKMDEKEREGLADVIQREDNEIRRVQTQASRNVNFGPSFGFAFGSDASS
jgi:Protein of unknown function (DUF3533)